MMEEWELLRELLAPGYAASVAASSNEIDSTAFFTAFAASVSAGWQWRMKLKRVAVARPVLGGHARVALHCVRAGDRVS